MVPHRTETRLLRKLLRATALCFRHKRPKSRGVYVPLNPPLRYTLQAAPKRSTKKEDFFQKSSLLWRITSYLSGLILTDLKSKVP